MLATDFDVEFIEAPEEAPIRINPLAFFDEIENLEAVSLPTGDEEGIDPETGDRKRNKKTDQDYKREIDQCGTWQYRLVPRTGIFSHFQAKCGHFREGCVPCLADRASTLKERIYTVFADGKGVSHLAVDNIEEATELVRGMTKDQYMRLVDKDGVYHIFAQYNLSDSPEIGEALEEETVQDMPWTDLALTPKGVNLSGKMGAKKNTVVKKETEEKPEEPQIVHVDSIIQTENITRSVIEEAIEEVYALTYDLVPEAYSLDSLQRAVNQRTNTLVNVLMDKGYENIRMAHYEVSVKLSQIEWTKELGKVLESINPRRIRKGLKPIILKPKPVL